MFSTIPMISFKPAARITWLAIAMVSLIASSASAQVSKTPTATTRHQNKSSSRDATAGGPQVTVNVLRNDPYADDIDGQKTTATMVEVILDPLASSPPHRHPGAVSGYILEGTFEFQVEGGELKTLKKGDTFFEPKMILHQVSRNPDKQKRTRVLATIVHPTSAKSISIPEPVEHKKDD